MAKTLLIIRREAGGQLRGLFTDCTEAQVQRGAAVPLPVELERMQDSRDLLPQVPQVDAVIG